MRWYGPFADMESARDWDRTNHIPCCLYLMSGMKKYAKSSVHYYIGKAERSLITDRFKDKNHHINDFSRIKEIWLGSVANKKATHDDVKLIEKMLTSYFVGEVGEDKMLNMINFCLPASNVYVLSEWINPYSELAWENYQEILLQILSQMSLSTKLMIMLSTTIYMFQRN